MNAQKEEESFSIVPPRTEAERREMREIEAKATDLYAKTGQRKWLEIARACRRQVRQVKPARSPDLFDIK